MEILVFDQVIHILSRLKPDTLLTLRLVNKNYRHWVDGFLEMCHGSFVTVKEWGMDRPITTSNVFLFNVRIRLLIHQARITEFERHIARTTNVRFHRTWFSGVVWWPIIIGSDRTPIKTKHVIYPGSIVTSSWLYPNQGSVWNALCGPL